MTEREIFADTALRIAERLVRTARWQGDACAWGQAGGQPHSGNLYRGTAGIALFLAEAGRLTGDAGCRRAAEGAARHAMSWAARVTAPHPGLFTGRVGAGWAVAQVGMALGKEEHVRAGADTVRWVASVPPPRGNDVTEGIAGVVLALLQLAPLAGETGALATAAAWGRALCDRSVAEPWGWSWPAGSPDYVRNLLGYAHGASGIGHALLELAAVTGEAGFRYGAEQAFLYERRYHRPELGNWPDFRYAAADAAPRADPAPAPYHPSFRTAWCHGATGIGLARLRAWELLGTPRYAAEARSAVTAARRYPRGDGTNFSLCHGTAGTVELLAEAARVLREPPLLDEAAVLAAEGCERFERAGKGWACGTRDGAGDAGLMLGEAGIGLTLLRLAGLSTASVLLPRASGPLTVPRNDGAESRRLALRGVRCHFGTALDAFTRLGRMPEPPSGRGDDPGPLAAHRAFRSTVAAESDPQIRALLADALRPELAAFEMELGAIDRSEERWGNGGETEPDWERGWIGLSAHARVVETAHDWTQWLEEAPSPPERATAWLVVRRHNQAQAHRLEPFAAAVIAAVQPASPLPGVIAAVSTGFSAGAPPPERLAAAVTAQLATAWRMGAIQLEPEPPLEATLQRLAAAAVGTAPPAAIQARDVIARQVEWARERLKGGDPLLAHMVALTTAAELEPTLHFVHARVLFADLLSAVHHAASPLARSEALGALLEVVGGAFATDEMLLPGVHVRG